MWFGQGETDTVVIAPLVVVSVQDQQSRLLFLISGLANVAEHMETDIHVFDRSSRNFARVERSWIRWLAECLLVALRKSWLAARSAALRQRESAIARRVVDQQVAPCEGTVEVDTPVMAP